MDETQTRMNCSVCFKERGVFLGVMRKGNSADSRDWREVGELILDDVRFRQCLFGWRLGGIWESTRPRCCDRTIALVNCGPIETEGCCKKE